MHFLTIIQFKEDLNSLKVTIRIFQRSANL